MAVSWRAGDGEMVRRGWGRGLGRRAGFARAFSMIELAIVVVIVGILAGIAVVRLSNLAERSRYTHMVVFMRDAATRIEIEYQSNGEYPNPPDLEGWFSNNAEVLAPFEGYAPGVVRVNKAGQLHPGRKVLNVGERVFWYNRANGAFRVRVPAQKSEAESLALYNKLNSSWETKVGPAPGEIETPAEPD